MKRQPANPLDHPWQECRPALLSSAPADPIAEDIMARGLRIAWKSVSDSDREAFHRACCLHSQAPDDWISVKKITEALQAQCRLIADIDPSTPQQREPSA